MLSRIERKTPHVLTLVEYKKVDITNLRLEYWLPEAGGVGVRERWGKVDLCTKILGVTIRSNKFWWVIDIGWL
jgi:hypothetical protein